MAEICSLKNTVLNDFNMRQEEGGRDWTESKEVTDASGECKEKVLHNVCKIGCYQEPSWLTKIQEVVSQIMRRGHALPKGICFHFEVIFISCLVGYQSIHCTPHCAHPPTQGQYIA